MPDFSRWLLGVDVAGVNGRVVDAKALKNEGLVFAFAKVSEGVTFADPLWQKNRDAILGQGLVCGGYHFLNRTDPAAQVASFLGKLGVDPYSLLLAVDVETGLSGIGPNFATVLSFADEFKRALPGHPLIVYSGGWYWRGIMGNPDGSHIGPLWDSSYIAGKALCSRLYKTGGKDGKGVTPTYFKAYGGWSLETRVIRQFSSTGTSGGMGGVDCDAFWGTVDELRGLMGKRPVAPPVVIPDDWTPEGRRLQTLGVMQGRDDGLMHPYEPATRQDLAVMLGRMLDLPKG
ncbi:MAG: glycoside hydrolase family 25 protein [Dehalococcoidales bacterium]|nr:glycoside hydrolase family 25 protein [Dehalococcoidales bacterium]